MSSQIQTEIVQDPSVRDGEWIVAGTRIPAKTILAYLRDGYSARDIFEDYPSLPRDGIDAVKLWAQQQFGSNWEQYQAREDGDRSNQD